MPYSVSKQTFVFQAIAVTVCLPSAEQVHQQYLNDQQKNPSTPFPYWAKIWPSAIAMSTFLSSHIEYYREKNVLELAAGLGLPSLVAAAHATKVVCSDYMAAPLAIVAKSIAENKQYAYMTCALLNWEYLPENLHTDVLLLSDVNYHPAAFSHLYQLIQRFIDQNTTIILATPQRLAAKSFINGILAWCIQQEVYTINQTDISVLVLQKTPTTASTQ